LADELSIVTGEKYDTDKLSREVQEIVVKLCDYVEKGDYNIKK